MGRHCPGGALPQPRCAPSPGGLSGLASEYGMPYPCCMLVLPRSGGRTHGWQSGDRVGARGTPPRQNGTAGKRPGECMRMVRRRRLGATTQRPREGCRVAGAHAC